MIRFIVFSIFRILLAALLVYFVLAVIRGIVRALSGFARGSSSNPTGRPQSQNPLKPQEPYKDVKDATFVELPDQKDESRSEERA